MSSERLRALRGRIERRRLGLIPDLNEYNPETDRKIDGEDVFINDSRNRRGLIRRFSTLMEGMDPLGGLMIDPAYFTSVANVKKALRINEPRIPVASVALWVQGYPGISDRGGNSRGEERYYPRTWRSKVESLEGLLNGMSEGTGEVPLSLIAFEFGFEAFVYFFSESSDATIWDCSYGGWMMKRRMLNVFAKEFDDWDEDDICGMSIYRPKGVYATEVGDPVADWIAAFTDIYHVFLDGDCPLATRELLYLIFRGQDIRKEDSCGVMNLEDCVSLWFDLFLARDYFTRDEIGQYTGKSRFDIGDLEAYVADIASDLLSSYVLWFPEDQVVMDLLGYISAQVRDGYLDPSPAFDSALDNSDPIELCLLDDWSVSSLTRALMTRYGLKSKNPIYRRILDDNSSFIEGD